MSVLVKAQPSVFDKQGHRGCRGIMPENTIAAMIKALDIGVTTLEMDICFTADGKVILSHEPFFSHYITTKPDGTAVTAAEEKSLNIYRMTYEEVLTYDVGIKMHPAFPQQQKMKATKPLLEEVIDQVEQYCFKNNKPSPYYNIETKTSAATDMLYHPPPAEFVDKLMQVVSGKNISDRIVIQSFDVRTLQYLRKNYPEIKTSLLIGKSERLTFAQKIAMLGFVPEVASPEHTLVDQAMIEYCHKQHMRIIPWTVNDPETANRLKKMKVDGLISDYPGIL